MTPVTPGAARRRAGAGVRVGRGANTSRVGPCSTARPSWSTSTRSHSACTTPRSCDTITRLRSSSSRRRASRSRIWARTDTSSALTGSSATSSRGFGAERPGDGDALLLAARELVRVAPDGRRVDADGGEHLGDRAASWSPGTRKPDERLTHDVAGGEPWIERAERVLEHDLGVAPEPAQRRRSSRAHLPAVELDARRTSPGRVRAGCARASTCPSPTRRRCRPTPQPRRRGRHRPAPGARREVRDSDVRGSLYTRRIPAA